MKNQGMKARIQDETEEICQENKALNNEIHTLFRKHRVPWFCNSWMFYALYYPRNLKEILTFLLYIVLIFAGIPYLVYSTFSVQKIWYLIPIYLIDILVFGGSYLLINNQTKGKHHKVLKEGRLIRKHIEHNKKRMKLIERGIRRDKDEAMYGLEEYDTRLDVLEKQNAEILNARKQALDLFDRETMKVIRREILSNNEERLKSLEDDCKEAEKELLLRKENVQFWNRTCSEKFGNDLGMEFMEPEMISLLIEAYYQGAANMMEAQAMVRNQLKQGSK